MKPRRLEARQGPSAAIFAGGIRARLFLLITLVLLPMALLLVYTNYQHYRTMRRSELQNEMEMAQGAATTFAVYLNGIQQQLFILEQAIGADAPYADRKTTELLKATAEQSPAIRDLSLLDATGRVVASSNAAMMGRMAAGHPYFQKIVAGEPYALSDLFAEDDERQTPTFVVASAIRGDDGELLGAIAAGIGIENVQGLTLMQDRPAEGTLAIFDGQGTIVYMNPHMPLSWEERLRWRNKDNLLQHALQEKKARIGVMETTELQGEWLAARVPIGDLDWIAGARRPTEVAFGPLRQALLHDVVLGMVLAIMAFLLASILARTISRPIMRLEQDVLHMSDGQIVQRKEVKSPAEIRSLRHNVTAMATSLIGAKQAADDANRVKSEFMANMSHELRTPMTVIMGSVELLQTMDVDSEKRQLLEFAYNSAQRLLGLIDDLLDFSRLEAGRLRVKDSVFELRKCVQLAVETFRKPAQDKKVRLAWEVTAELPQCLHGDPDRLGQILLNLVGNAVKFTDEGEVRVRAVRKDERLIFSVSDTGIGIPADRLQQIFHPFIQVDGSTTRRHEGTGLGLAICKELAELMGGEIEVTSTLGQGSTFFLDIPLRPAQLPEETTAALRSSHEQPQTLQALLVEDDAAVREVIKDLLSRRGLDVTLAQNGSQALDIWRSAAIDLIFMDLQMPDMDGFETTRQIRKAEQGLGRSTFICALSAHVRAEDQQRCMAQGMDAFLAKPLSLDQLDIVLQKVWVASQGK